MDEREMYKSSPDGMFRNARLKGTSRQNPSSITSLSDQSICSSNMSVFERGACGKAASSKEDADNILNRDSVVALCRKYCTDQTPPPSNVSCDKSNSDDSPDSELASTTTQLLFVDPRSDRTSLGDLYEPCFSMNPAQKRPSIRRQWNFSSLDLRLIDEDTPTTCSPDLLESECAPLENDTETEKKEDPPAAPSPPSPVPCTLHPENVGDEKIVPEKRNSVAKIGAHKRSKCFPL